MYKFIFDPKQCNQIQSQEENKDILWVFKSDDKLFRYV